MEKESCSLDNNKNSCCSSAPSETINYTKHWDKAYINNPAEKLGWFETDLAPTLQLISTSEVKKDALIINIGAGSTVLIDELLAENYSNLIATDISEVALDSIKNRVNSKNVSYIVDDLTNPKLLNEITSVDLWIDRAVLHFFTETKDQNTYFDLLKSKINNGGFALLAEFNLEGATKCSGLPVQRYNARLLQEKLGSNFKLIESFDYSYTMPSGDKRPYVYTLFQKIN